MRRIFAMPIRGRSVNDKSWRCIVVTKSLLVGRATKPVGYREHIVCNVGCEVEKARRTSWRIASPRTISRGSTRVFCVVCSLLDRYHLRFFSPALSLPLTLCRLRRVLVPLPIYSPLFPPSPPPPPSPFLLLLFRCPHADEEEPWSVEDPIHIPSTPTLRLTMRRIVPFFWRYRFFAIIDKFYYTIREFVEYRDMILSKCSNVYTSFLTWQKGDLIRYFILDIRHVSLWAVYIKHKLFNKCIFP